MVEGFSEPGGTFATRTFISNERSIQYVIPLKARRNPEGFIWVLRPTELHLRCRDSTEDRIHYRHPAQNMLVNYCTKRCFELSPNRADFVRASILQTTTGA
jgi:hypothetical protein